MNFRDMDDRVPTEAEAETLKELRCIHCGRLADERPAIFTRADHELIWWHGRPCRK